MEDVIHDSVTDERDGEIVVPIRGGSVTLIANLAAAKAINRHFQGFQAALQRVATGDLDALLAIVRYGSGVKSDAEARALEQRVYRTGLLRLTEPCTDFLLLCANGGRDAGEWRPGDPGEPPKAVI